ncbi:heparanase 50 kDa subunit [Thecamonas trahens ATCC 50062]|uniref:Heparanase 50 kDa subunit n=1 Tax=Thecamonas trahens ATCC 50062 TaxID=461836 RepID=A0A0L0D4W6_THETB|nr:heparanase 50 kDa subunit [Thecamonas trahens ATCC 50062]KNC46348.1 heparanase 50 kDa subunit [Thecamonas trahens ATCC 50062]|eukprot:XP_013760641.1 heparanase 50 kDa subunit [Thecamonas trahens ATCC 50062]
MATVVVITLALVLALGSLAHGADVAELAAAASTHGTVETATALTGLSDKFLSVSFDVAEVAEVFFWNTTHTPIPYQSPRLVALAKALTPATLRVGGTAADWMWYDVDGTVRPAHGYKYTLNASQWDALNAFAHVVGFELVFGINAGPGPRAADGSWVPHNARALMEYSAARGYSVSGWEFANEPNLFVVNDMGLVPPTRFAADMALFEPLVREVYPASKVIAPDVAYQLPIIGEAYPEFMRDFVRDTVLEYNVTLDVVTWHWYPLVSFRLPFPSKLDPWLATVARIMAPHTLDAMDKHMTSVSSIIASYSPDAEMWLGETASASYGGQPNVSNAFASGFWYLDELGQIAAAGGKRVVRQTLTGSDYGLLDWVTLAPRPDYWTALLFKRLVGDAVLSVQLTDGPRDASGDLLVRAYAYCGTERDTVVVTAINLQPATPLELTLDFGATPAARADYVLTAPGGDLGSTSMLLNGKLLELNQAGSLPDLPPLAAVATTPLSLPPASYGFFVVTIDVAACGTL